MRSGHTGSSIFSCPILLPWAARALEVVFLGSKLEWKVPEPTWKGLCPITFFPLPITLRTNLKPSKSLMLRLLSCVGGATLRKELGSGNPTTRQHGDRVTFQSSSSTELSSICGQQQAWCGWRRASLDLKSQVPCTKDEALRIQGKAHLHSHPSTSLSQEQSTLGTHACSGPSDVTPAQPVRIEGSRIGSCIFSYHGIRIFYWSTVYLQCVSFMSHQLTLVLHTHTPYSFLGSFPIYVITEC